MSREAAYGLAGFLLGAGISGFVVWKVAERQFNNTLEAELEAMREYHDRQARKNKTGPYEKIEDLAKKYVESLADLGYSSEEEADADPSFDQVTATWEMYSYGVPGNKEALLAELSDDEEELDPEENDEELDPTPHRIQDHDHERSSDRPYVISFEEFFEEHGNDYSKVEIVYYEGDDTLADDRDQPVPDPSYAIGDEALTRFGDMSHDANTVYVRNERISVDYEISRVKGTYQEIVMGIKPEKSPRVKKVRKDNDNED